MPRKEDDLEQANSMSFTIVAAHLDLNTAVSTHLPFLSY